MAEAEVGVAGGAGREKVGEAAMEAGEVGVVVEPGEAVEAVEVLGECEWSPAAA